MVDVDKSEALEPHPIRGWTTLKVYNDKVRKHLEGHTKASGIRRSLYACRPRSVTPEEVVKKFCECETAMTYPVHVPPSHSDVRSALGVMSKVPWTGVKRVASLQPGGLFVYERPQLLTD